MTDCIHPLPIGTRLRFRDGGSDEGITSWDETNITVERIAPPGSIAIIDHVFSDDGLTYSVIFPGSEVWNLIDASEIDDPSQGIVVVELGNGSCSSLDSPAPVQ